MSDKENGDCAICGQRYTHFGNNPEPILKLQKRVCDQCNSMFVIPVRMGVANFSAERARIIAEALSPYDVQTLSQIWQATLWRPTPEQMEELLKLSM
jgi:hypothetical protein